MKDWPVEFKIEFLKVLGYGSDGTYVLDKDNKILLDKYTSEPVKITNMAILPIGPVPCSALILDDNVISIIQYMDEYPDVL